MTVKSENTRISANPGFRVPISFFVLPRSSDTCSCLLWNSKQESAVAMAGHFVLVQKVTVTALGLIVRYKKICFRFQYRGDVGQNYGMYIFFIRVYIIY